MCWKGFAYNQLKIQNQQERLIQRVGNSFPFPIQELQMKTEQK